MYICICVCMRMSVCMHACMYLYFIIYTPVMCVLVCFEGAEIHSNASCCPPLQGLIEGLSIINIFLWASLVQCSALE